LLVWSKDAATSHFVEFEWNTAIALKKTILPCWLDDTPLPAALRAVNAIDLRKMETALPRILQALRRPVIETDPEHRAEVIAKLQEITSTKPEAVVRDLKAMFTQQGWNVQGNVYQAGGDIHVTIEQPSGKPEKRLVEKWQAWVVIFIGLLAISGLLMDIPQKVQEAWNSNESGIEVTQNFGGIVWNEAHEPLEGVEVRLPEFGLAVSTGKNGVFAFQVKAQRQRPVNIIARRDEYETYDADGTLGNTSFNFILRRKK
jgi:hypothetical protein